ncbi:MAG TPA: hypothetical protein VD833_26570 [Vicinamibacterales bacterium]|nr:hypothetical protein [Vicinamibacterales bacterium]
MTTLTCRDVLDLVEPIAAGDVEVESPVRAHLESCPRCAAALADARRLEAALGALAVPAAPARFTPAILSRIRRERWRTEQNVDRVFNVAIACALVLVAGSVVALLNLNDLLAAGRVVWAAMASLGGEAARHVIPLFVTYLAAAALLVSALGMWWWAERRLSV